MTSTLHTVNKSPLQTSLWTQCLNALLPGDTLLAIENGVLLISDQALISKIKATGCSIAFLEPDLCARGLHTYPLEDTQRITMEGFVNLSCQHQKVVSWF